MAAEKLKKTFRSNVKTKLGPFGNIINFSDNLFSKGEFSLLHKILNFCPRPNEYNTQNINNDLVKFYRDVKLKVHFGSTENNANEPIFKSNSNCLPDKLPRCVEAFIKAVNYEIKSPKTQNPLRDNLTKSEREAPLSLLQ